MAKVEIKLEIDGKSAKASINEATTATDKLSKSLSGIKNQGGKLKESFSSAFSVFSGTLGAQLAIEGIKSIGRAFVDTIDAAKEQEAAVSRLNAALKNSGSFTKEASQDLQTFASELQKVSTVGDEVALNQLALAKSFGASNEQAKEIVSAAAEMSAALGIDLESATRNVAKTLGGYAGELGEVIPGLKNLTQEQLRAGQGIDLLSKQFQGFQKAQLQTFAGSQKSFLNSFGDLREVIGGLITDNPVMIKTFNILKDIFSDLSVFVLKNKDSFIELSKTAFNFAGTAIRIFSKVGSAIIKILGVVRRAQQFVFDNVLKPIFNGIIEGYKRVANVLGITVDDATSVFDKIGEGIDSLTDTSFGSFADSLESIGTTIGEKMEEPLENVKNQIKDLPKTVKDSTKKISDTKVDSKKGSGTGSDSGSGSDKQEKQNLAEAIRLGLGLNESIPIQDGLNAIQGALSASDGIGAASGLIQGAGAAAANAFLPGSGGLASALLGQLTKDPEDVKNFFKDMAKGIPIIIEKIIENIPFLIEALIEATPQLIEQISLKLPIALAKSTARAIGRTFQNIGREFQQFIGNSLNEFLQGFEEGLRGLFSGIARAGESFFRNIISAGEKFIKSLVEGIKDALPKIGGGGGGLGIDLGFAKFAEGGQGFTKRVPSGFNNDTFPARLTSGELVVDRSTAKKLTAFLDNVSGMTNNVMIDISPNAQKLITVQQNEASALGFSVAT